MAFIHVLPRSRCPQRDTLCKFDFERVLCERVSFGECRCNRRPKRIGIVQRYASQRRFGRLQAPRLVCNAAHRESRRFNAPVADCHGGRRRYQREFVRLAVAKLEVVRGASLNPRWHFNRYDEIATVEHVVAFGRVTGQPMEFREGDRPLSTKPAHQNNRIQRGERHRQVRGICRYAIIGPPEDREIAIEPISRRTTGAGPPFVAREVVFITKVCAASPLHDVPAYGGHVSELA